MNKNKLKRLHKIIDECFDNRPGIYAFLEDLEDKEINSNLATQIQKLIDKQWDEAMAALKEHYAVKMFDLADEIEAQLKKVLTKTEDFIEFMEKGYEL